MRGIRIRPDQAGTRGALFDLEADVMDVVWEEDLADFSVADVHRRLARRREIAYTTVMTTVSRLHDKGLLSRRRDGRRYLYTAVMGREAFLRELARQALGSLLHRGPEALEALLVERVAEADEADLDRLEALIRRRREDLSR